MEVVQVQDWEELRQSRENLIRNTNSVKQLVAKVRGFLYVQLMNEEEEEEEEEEIEHGDDYLKCIRLYNELLSDDMKLSGELEDCFKNTDNEAAWVLFVKMKNPTQKNDVPTNEENVTDSDFSNNVFHKAADAAINGDFNILKNCIDEVLGSTSNNKYLLTGAGASSSMKNILHFSVFKSYTSKYVPNQLKCINLILTYAQKLHWKNKMLDETDREGKTALHIAIENKSGEICKELLSHGADLKCYPRQEETEDENKWLQMLFTNVPDVLLYLLDRNINVTLDQSKNEQMIQLDYTHLVSFSHPSQCINAHVAYDGTAVTIQQQQQQPLNPTNNAGTGNVEAGSENTMGENKDMTFLARMVYTPKFSEKILGHPVTKIFVQKKWESMTKYLTAYFFDQLFLYILYGILMVDIYWVKCPRPVQNNTNSTNSTDNESDGNSENNTNSTNSTDNDRDRNSECTFSIFEYVSIGLVLYGLNILLFLMEIFEATKIRKLNIKNNCNPYLSEWENYFQASFLIISLATTLPILCQQTSFIHFQYGLASIGVYNSGICVFCAIGNGNFRCSEYVFVYGKIIKRLGKVLLTFLPILTAFMISLGITSPELGTFYFTKTFMMLSGEFNFDDDFKDPGSVISTFGQIQYVLFGLVVTIVFVNIFLGYTVGDIEKLRENGDVTRRKIQIKQIFIMDALIKEYNKIRRSDLTPSNLNRGFTESVPLGSINPEWQEEIRKFQI